MSKQELELPKGWIKIRLGDYLNFQYGKGLTKYIRYTSNGEPLVHPKSYDMIQYAVSNSGTKVTLTTNGTLLNEKRMKKLLDTGLHMIDISIDAFHDKTYKKVRVGGNLEITKKNLGITLVIDKTKVVGIFTDGDLRRCINKKIDIHNTKIDQVMTKKFKTISPNSLAVDAAQIMEDNKIFTLVVMAKDKYVGVITMHDLIEARIL